MGFGEGYIFDLRFLLHHTKYTNNLNVAVNTFNR